MNYKKKFAEKLKKRFFDTHKFINKQYTHVINKFILLLRKDVYSYGYMDI